MKIHQLLNSPSVIITNEENEFIRAHGDDVSLSILNPHDKVVANNLVRKGVYSISNNRNYITKRTDSNE